MLSTLAMFVTGVRSLSPAASERRRRRCWSTRACSLTTCATSRSPTRSPIGAAFLPLEPVWLKWIVAAVLIGIYAWYVKGHFEADPDVDAEDLAPLRFHRLDRRDVASEPARAAPAGRQPAGRWWRSGSSSLGAVFFVDAVEHLGDAARRRQALLALVIAPIATELPEKFNSVIWVRGGKDTLAMGNITGAMVFQSTIPTVVALVFAAECVGRRREGSYIAFASAGIAFLASAADLHPDGPVAGALRGRGLLVGGAFYLAYLALVIARLIGADRLSVGVPLVASGDRPDGPAAYSADLVPARSRAAMITAEADRARPATGAALTPPAPARPRRPHLLFRGRLRPDARREGQHHDPRVHVRDRDVRGHPRLLERGAGQLYGLKLREHVERIRQSCRILLMDDVPSVDELTGLIVETVRRNGFREDAYIRPSFYKSTQAIGVRLHDLEQRAVHHRPALRELHRHRDRRPGDDLVLATQRRRGAAGPRQDRRRLREHGVPEVARPSSTASTRRSS